MRAGHRARDARLWRIDGGEWMTYAEAREALGGRKIELRGNESRIVTKGGAGRHVLERSGRLPYPLAVAVNAKTFGASAWVLDGRAIERDDACMALHYSRSGLRRRLDAGGGRAEVDGHVLEEADPDALMARWKARAQEGMPIMERSRA